MIEIRMPQKGLSEETAILTKWFVKPGDEVKANQYLFSIENGKATYDIETEADGVVLACFGEENDEIPIETVVCVIGDRGETYEISDGCAAVKEEPEAAAQIKTPEEPIKLSEVTFEKQAVTDANGRFFISPRAKMRAQELGINVLTLLASGPEGRIVEADVLKAKEMILKQETEKKTTTGPSAAPTADSEKKTKTASEEEYTAVPHTGIRRATARNMMNSLQSSAQLTLVAAFDCSSLNRSREMLNEDAARFGIDKVTVNDMICFAAAKTVAEFPRVNAHYCEEEMRLFRHVNLGIAVSTDRGLLVPVVKKAEEMSLFSMIRENRRLIADCREGRIAQNDMNGGTFTVTNLGAYGVRCFTPILNPPQVAILGVGTMVKRLVETGTGYRSYKEMELSLTIDHRGIDGADGAQFLKKLVANLEQYEIVLAL